MSGHRHFPARDDRDDACPACGEVPLGTAHAVSFVILMMFAVFFGAVVALAFVR